MLQQLLSNSVEGANTRLLGSAKKYLSFHADRPPLISSRVAFASILSSLPECIGYSDSFMMSIEKCKEKGLLGGGYNNIYLHESKVSKFSKFSFGNFPLSLTVPMSRPNPALSAFE
jgi:hypothetical protein